MYMSLLLYFYYIISEIIITRWYDNKCVNLCLTYCDPDSISDVKRWNRTEKNFVNINCPSVVKEYNQCMGGVDLCDMLISLYRTNIKTKRWYIKILFYCIDICKVNGWLIARRHCNQLNIAKINQLTLLQLTTQIASSLSYAEKPLVAGNLKENCVRM